MWKEANERETEGEAVQCNETVTLFAAETCTPAVCSTPIINVEAVQPVCNLL